MSEIQQILRHSQGTEKWYRAPFTRGMGLYTDGMLNLAECADCHWLIDAVFSYLPKIMIKEEWFYPVILERVKDCEFKLTIGDEENPYKITQDISFSDYPEDRLKLFLVKGAVDKEGQWVLMLPNEY